MIQQKLKIGNELVENLRSCDEVWIAVALISDKGYRIIQDNINPLAKQHYLVGIGLPTSPAVLNDLKEKEGKGIFSSRVYHKQGELFHPKVYILKVKDRLLAYVGSGNCTEGGFYKNVELTIKTDDQDFCTRLLKWFMVLFKFGKTITDDFVLSYTDVFNRRIIRVEQDIDDLDTVFAGSDQSNWLQSIDFSHQFFKLEHYAAFEGNKPWSMEDRANEERILVRQRLFALHDKLYPLMAKKKWDLHEHYVFEDTVSSAIHNQFTSAKLDGIWLHYGRDKPTIKALDEKLTPLDFMRMQVIIHKDSIGVWNRIGKDYGSRIDREYFKNKIKNDSDYREKFYAVISSLSSEYYIRINQEKKYVPDFPDEAALTNFVLNDNPAFYFIIGIEFLPGDERLSVNNIATTIIGEFEKLYPTYEMMKYRLH